jgi:prepilin-type N-terminal cleavage/methylation domain-containing protein
MFTQEISRKSRIAANRSGFTLIEILVVLGLIAILAAIVLVAINPARQFAQARDSQRRSNVTTILDAIGQNLADNKGVFTCPGVTIPVDPAVAGVVGTSGIDLRSCLVPKYIAEMPVDPKTGTACVDTACTGGYNTKYTVLQASVANGSRVTVSAPDTELATPAISVTR